MHRDVFAKRPLEDRDRLLDGVIQVEGARFQRLLARKGQHALHQLSAALCRFVDLFDHRRDFGIVRDAAAAELRHADDHGEDIVEVVGDAASQLANRLHLLGMAQLLFQRDAIRHVAPDKEMLLVGFRPNPLPAQRNDAAVFVYVAAIKVAHGEARLALRISSRVVSRSSPNRKWMALRPDHFGWVDTRG